MTIQPARESLVSRSHYVYAFSNAEGQVLYVGCTSNPDKRVCYDHRSKPWWGDVAKTEISEGMSRYDATILERSLIRKHKPLHNKQYFSPTTVWMLWRRNGEPANSPHEMFRDPIGEPQR